MSDFWAKALKFGITVLTAVVCAALVLLWLVYMIGLIPILLVLAAIVFIAVTIYYIVGVTKNSFKNKKNKTLEEDKKDNVVYTIDIEE